MPPSYYIYDEDLYFADSDELLSDRAAQRCHADKMVLALLYLLLKQRQSHKNSLQEKRGHILPHFEESRATLLHSAF